jgi:hypothetical protein
MEKSMEGSKPLTASFLIRRPSEISRDDGDSRSELLGNQSTSEKGQGPQGDALCSPSPDSELREELLNAITDLEKKLQSKRIGLTGQNETRHRAVLQFLRLQKYCQKGETRATMALNVARCFDRGRWFAEKLIGWEIKWKQTRTIPEGRQGCFQKTKSWFNDEGVELAVREYCAQAKEGSLRTLY